MAQRIPAVVQVTSDHAAGGSTQCSAADGLRAEWESLASTDLMPAQVVRI